MIQPDRFVSWRTRRWVGGFAAALLLTLGVPAIAQDPPDQLPKAQADLVKAIRKVRDLMAAEKYEEAAQVMAAEVKRHPNSRGTLLAAAMATQQAAFGVIKDPEKRKAGNKYFHDAARYFRSFKKAMGGKIPANLLEQYATVIYNDACSFALDGDKEKAIKVLKEAVEAGFSEYDVIKDDTDFQSLRDDPKYMKRFDELVEQVKSKAAGPRVRT